MSIQFKIAMRLIISFGLLNIMITCLNGYTIVQGQGTQTLVDATLSASKNESKIHLALEKVYNVRMGMWAFLTTQDLSAWTKTYAGVAGIDRDLVSLIKTAENKKYRQNLMNIKKLLAQFGTAVGAGNQVLSLEGVQKAEKIAHDLDKIAVAMATEYHEVATGRATQATDRIHDLNYWSYIIGFISLIVGVVLWWGTSRSIVRPIDAVTGAMSKLADGDNDTVVPGTRRKDEVGDIARAVEVFKENAQQFEAMRKSQEAAELKAEEKRRKELQDMARSFEQSVMGIVRTVSDSSEKMQCTAETMSSAAQQSSSQASSVGQSSASATVNVETVASAAEELSASIGEIGNQVGRAAKVSKQAAQESVETSSRIQALYGATEKIGGIISMINDIAEQTNLLALNATIEAARAGEAGKGFAVVASEVKNLAGQTSSATEEISKQIASVQEETQQSVAAVKKIEEIIHNVEDISASIAQSVEQQDLATQDIARNVQETAASTREVSVTIDGVTEASETTGAAARDVLDISNELSGNAKKLENEVLSFLSKVREEK